VNVRGVANVNVRGVANVNLNVVANVNVRGDWGRSYHLVDPRQRR